MSRNINKRTGLELWTAGYSDKGQVRNNNEDSFLVEEVKNKFKGPSSLICVVADGMGGQDYGEVASQSAVAVFHQLTSCIHKMENASNWLEYATREAHLDIKNKYAALNESNGMGTTLVAGLFINNQCFIANVGDSRAYLFREGSLSRLTRDHSLMEIMLEKELIQPDEVYSHPRRGEISRFLGQNNEVEADIYEVTVQSGDFILFCSDGLWEMVRDPDIAVILEAHADPSQTVNRLIKAANRAGGKDNITAVLVNVLGLK